MDWEQKEIVKAKKKIYGSMVQWIANFSWNNSFINLALFLLEYEKSGAILLVPVDLIACKLAVRQIIGRFLGIPLSLSTIVLNSRDWSEIVWLPEISRFKINLAISFI